MGVAERILDCLFEYQEIRDGCEAGTRTDNPVYLKRYFLVKNAFDADRSAGVQGKPRLSLTWHRKSNGVQLYLHHILRSDADRELHDHPWDFLSIILWRGYREETQPECVTCREVGRPQKDCIAPPAPVQRRKLPGMMLFRRAEHRHRVLLVDGPAWSLIFTSSKRRSWGFWRAGEFIPWRWFVARKCEGTRG